MLAACATLARIDEPIDRPDGGNVAARSCADIKRAGVNADGTNTIDIDGLGPNPPFSVYCRNMATVEPTEYLELPANPDAGLPNSNVSGFVLNAPAGVCTEAPTRTVAFLKVRLNIRTLHIDPSDRTFSYVEGDAGPGLDYGFAGSCVSGGDMSGRGNVDLVGTPFRMTMETTFVTTGYLPGGSSTFSADRKRVDLTGGGYSGSTAVPADAGGIGLEFAP